MAEETKWEYRIREITMGQIHDHHPLGKRDTEDLSATEKALNELTDEGWEPMPMTIQFVGGTVALMFRKPKEAEGAYSG